MALSPCTVGGVCFAYITCVLWYKYSDVGSFLVSVHVCSVIETRQSKVGIN